MHLSDFSKLQAGLYDLVPASSFCISRTCTKRSIHIHVCMYVILIIIPPRNVLINYLSVSQSLFDIV